MQRAREVLLLAVSACKVAWQGLALQPSHVHFTPCNIDTVTGSRQTPGWLAVCSQPLTNYRPDTHLPGRSKHRPTSSPHLMCTAFVHCTVPKPHSELHDLTACSSINRLHLGRGGQCSKSKGVRTQPLLSKTLLLRPERDFDRLHNKATHPAHALMLQTEFGKLPGSCPGSKPVRCSAATAAALARAPMRHSRAVRDAPGQRGGGRGVRRCQVHLPVLVAHAAREVPARGPHATNSPAGLGHKTWMSGTRRLSWHGCYLHNCYPH